MFTFLKNLFRPKSAVMPTPENPTTLHPEALALILDFEGIDQPSKWPGNSSGITLGRGYDLGFCTISQLRTDWARHLPAYAIELLERACGVTGRNAAAIASRYGNIRITTAAADEVFARATTPKWIAETKRAFPGSQNLPPLIFGALVSLVFNRGGSMDGPSRLEMRQIHEHIELFNAGQMNLKDTAKAIANSIKLMQRLWPDTPGLQRRRRAESDLVLSAIR